MSRDAHKKARGFCYQRHYAVFLFLTTKDDEIIEEGNINGLEYEDITTINDNGKLTTYQIKFHTSNGCESFTKSNIDFFKTLGNKNNINVDRIYYIVSNDKDGNAYDKNFEIWRAEPPDVDKIIKDINTLKSNNDDSKVNKFNAYLKLEKSINDEELKKYIAKYTVINGPSYMKLIDNTYDEIKKRFSITCSKKCFFIRYQIFDIFDKNWFEGKAPCIINIKDELSNINITEMTINNGFHILIKIINTQIKDINASYDDAQINSIKHEIDHFINIFKDDIHYTVYIKLLSTLHELYIKYSTTEIKKIYKNICSIFCRVIMHKYKKDCILNDEQTDALISSIKYYCRHNIKKVIKVKPRLESTLDIIFIESSPI